MSDEITVRASVTVKNGNYSYASQPGYCTDDQATPGGGVPGTVIASESGTDVSFSPLVQPTWVELMNVEAADSGLRAEWGVYDPQTSVFIPIGELEPGDVTVLKLSRNFGEEWVSFGTATATAIANNTLRIKAYGGTCRVSVKAHEK